MLPIAEIESAVEIQKRSYQLLRWLGGAIDRGFISFSRAHEYSSAADAALEWIEEHYQNLPPNARPEAAQLRAFSNYFGSYVTTSFDLVNDPGTRRESRCGCDCAFCMRLVNISHLQVKKPSKHDKDRAKRKCLARIEMLAGEAGFRITPEMAASLMETHARSAAYSAYGLSLLERMRGAEGGLHVLALWRVIAWKPEGSPIKNFSLESEDIFAAERELLSAMKRTGAAMQA